MASGGPGQAIVPVRSGLPTPPLPTLPTFHKKETMKWQYKALKISVNGVFKPEVKTEVIEQALNEPGSAGWELVSSSSIATGNGATIEIVLIMKRPCDGAEQVASGPPPLPQQPG